MENSRPLRRVEAKLIKDLEETTIPFQGLGEKYGVSKQAIFDFCTRKGIKRPRKDHAQDCCICQALIKIAKQPRSEFISSRTIKEQLGLRVREYTSHIRFLRRKALISQRFGRLRSRSLEIAYRIYFEKMLPPWTIGRQLGIKNFHAVIKKHKALGWDIDDSFIAYDDEKEGMSTSEASRILGISVSTVQRYCDKGLLDFRRSTISQKRLVGRESVQELAEK